MDTVAQYLRLALQLAPMVVSLGEDIAQYVEDALAASKKDSGPTQEDWDKLHADEARMRAQLNAPSA